MLGLDGPVSRLSRWVDFQGHIPGFGHEPVIQKNLPPVADLQRFNAGDAN
jgi:hypothetical protein